MIQTIQIKNYKSIPSLELDLGRINVLIGENGCGKSNILEAIALGCAASAKKLDNEFLANRGIRITDSKWMRSAFHKDDLQKEIFVSFLSTSKSELVCTLNNDNKPYSKWEIDSKYNFSSVDLSDAKQKLDSYFAGLGVLITREDEALLMRDNSTNLTDYNKLWTTILKTKNISFDTKDIKFKTSYFSIGDLQSFIIYSPENTFLQVEESKIEPLGVKGEGLFKLIAFMEQEYPQHIEEIKKKLLLIDWFEDMKMDKDSPFIHLKDRFLDSKLTFFDQRNANEGFLYLLFYFSLFISNYTPKFFAIDNIDSALNPKLCYRLIEILVELAKEHDKQVILTTHNPAILDGLNLDDEDQRLFVVYRNADGHTKTRRIFKKEMPEGIEPSRLSEAFMRGSIGGLPKTF